jgi:tetratricopeptide (TPR) repeat protein
MYMRFIILLLLLGACLQVTAQDSTRNYKKSKALFSKQKEVSRLNSTATKLKDALESDDETLAAQQYERLSKQLEQKGELAKAEEYLSRALNIYTKQKDQAGIANTTRGIAKLQEAQNKLQPAINSYRNAAAVNTDKELARANKNDAQRLERADNPKAQQELAQDNIGLFKQKGDYEEVADAFKQVGESQLKQNKPAAAAKTFEKAMEVVPATSAISNTLSKKLVNAYADNNQVDTAIKLTRKMITQAHESGDTPAQIEELISLSELQAKNNMDVEAVVTLQKAYQLAIQHGNTLKAKTITERLVRQFQLQGNTGLSIDAYKHFMKDLDTLVRKDSSLIDAKLFELTNGRIRELEQEKKLQTELLQKRMTFSYFLIGSIAIMLLLLLLIVRSWMGIRKRNKKIALQSLRREMNPHFIFNSLNSVNQYIAENNELEANRYLSSYSSLMRNTMEHSSKDFVSIATELEHLAQYLELEHRRFRDKFEYSISIDESIDKDLLMIPNMILQPHLENAIWHGLRYKETKGLLRLDFDRKGSLIIITITDNGIGLRQSQQLKTKNQKAYTSRGLTNTKERIQLLNDIYKLQIRMDIREADEKAGGTVVHIEIPVLNKLP